jgi:hypothetical protein
MIPKSLLFALLAAILCTSAAQAGSPDYRKVTVTGGITVLEPVGVSGTRLAVRTITNAKLFAYFGLTKEDYELAADVVGYRLLFLAKDGGNPVQQVLVGEIMGGQLAISTTAQISKLVGPVTGGQVGTYFENLEGTAVGTAQLVPANGTLVVKTLSMTVNATGKNHSVDAPSDVALIKMKIVTGKPL